MSVNHINPVNPTIFVQPVSAEQIQGKAKEALVKWLNTFVGKEVKTQDVKFVNSKGMIWGSWDMEVPEPGKPQPKMCLPGFIMQFEYEGRPYAIHTNDYGTAIVNPAEQKLEDLKRKVLKEALKYFLPEVTSKNKRFSVKTTAKFIYNHTEYCQKIPLGMMVACKFLHDHKRGSYTDITDMNGKRVMHESGISQ